eukprot:m.107772 g.107772  ORF g.107772 m.107772 type:complete len:833 (+) comp15851_c0_seq5:98-2596(+)
MPPAREIVSINTLAVERLPEGHHVFIMQIAWSDGSCTIAKRSYDEISTLHNELSALFETSKSRILPPLPPNKAVSGLTKRARETREHALAEKQLPQIATYFQKVLKLDKAVAQSQLMHALFDTSVLILDNTHGLPSDSILRIGYLTKQGGKTKNWKRRHVLIDKQGQLVYYADNQAKSSCGGLDLGDALAIRPGKTDVPPNGWSPDTTEDCTFSIELADRTFYFYADNAESAQAWIADLVKGKDAAKNAKMAVARNAVDNIVLSGFLVKQGGRTKSWKERFCVLDKQHVLSYYNDESCKQANGFVNMAEATGIRSGYSDKTAWPEGVNSYCAFFIDMPGRTFLWYSKTPESAQAWMDALGRASSNGHTRRATISVSAAVHQGPTHRLNPKNIRRSGVLWKQGNGVKTWRKRFAVLDRDGFLSYYAEKRSREPAGQFDVAELRTVRAGDEEIAPNGWPPETSASCAFSVELPGRTFYFYAENPEAALGWMADIRAAKPGALERAAQTQQHRASSIVHSGYLVKQGGSNKNWRGRFCILDHDCQLCYFADEHATTPNGNLDISDALEFCEGSTDTAPNGWPEGASPYCAFSIAMPQRRYYFVAKTPELAQAWIAALRAAHKRAKDVADGLVEQPAGLSSILSSVQVMGKESDDDDEEDAGGAAAAAAGAAGAAAGDKTAAASAPATTAAGGYTASGSAVGDDDGDGPSSPSKNSVVVTVSEDGFASSEDDNDYNELPPPPMDDPPPLPTTAAKAPAAAPAVAPAVAPAPVPAPAPAADSLDDLPPPPPMEDSSSAAAAAAPAAVRLPAPPSRQAPKLVRPAEPAAALRANPEEE